MHCHIDILSRFGTKNQMQLKKRNEPILLIIIFFCVSLSSLKAQTLSEKYDLNFQQITICSRSWLSSGNANFFVDTATKYQGKAAFKLYYNRSAHEKRMQFNLSKIIVLPKSHGQKTYEVSLISKDNLAEDVWLKATLYNKEEEEIAAKSVRVNSAKWKRNAVSLKIAGAGALRISLSYLGNQDAGQSIWLDRAAIEIDTTDISQKIGFASSKEDSLAAKKGFKDKRLVPLLAGNDSTLLDGIKAIRGKRIIGIGESTHGSATVKDANYQFIRNLVVSHDCRLVMMEIPVDKALIMDLYVLGKIPLTYQKAIIADIRSSFSGYVHLIGFLDWLRKYNSSAERKVHVIGIDNISYPKLCLFNYHLALQGKEDGRFYLKKIGEENYAAVLAHAQTDTVLKEKLGKGTFEFYLSFLKNEVSKEKIEAGYKKNRDFNMGERVREMVRLFLDPGEKAAVYAHSGHMKCVGEYNEYMNVQAPLGLHLRKIYGDDYFAISFQVGQGTFTQDECSLTGDRIVDSLKNPPVYSLEYAALATRLDYFYYPSRYLGDAVQSCLFIPRESRHRDLYHFGSLKKRFDAYVFVKESTPIKEIERSALIYNLDYFEDERRKMNAILKEIEN